MVGGQAIDLQAAGQVPGHSAALDADGLHAMHARKTGAIIRASAVSGAIMAGASEAAVAAIDRFAADIGLAFQIVDDILDVEGSAEELGKTAGKDAAGTKPTYPALFGLDGPARSPPSASRAPAQPSTPPASAAAGSRRSPTGWSRGAVESAFNGDVAE